MNDHDWNGMLAEWIAIGAIAPESHDELERRFLRCLPQRPTRNRRTSR
jgi:hypothetical protein